MAPAQTDLNLEFEGLQAGAAAAPKSRAAGKLIWAYLNRFLARLRHYG